MPKKKPAKRPQGKTITKPTGRPSKYRPEMCDLVIESGKKGYSKEAIAGALGISNDTLYQWINKKSPYYHKDFSDAITLAHAYSRLYMEDLMLTKMVNKDGNLNNHAAAIIMRNVHGWDQKQTVEHTGKDGEALTFNFNLAPPEPIQIKDEHIIDDDEENNNG